MSTQKPTVLIVDDEPAVTELLAVDLEGEGCKCFTAASGEDALDRLAGGNIDVLLLDLRLPGVSGMEVLKEVVSKYPQTTAIIVSGTGDTRTAVEAMKMGAADYIPKPFDLAEINETVRRASAKALATACGVGYRKPGLVSCLDAIARGVEAKLDAVTGHSAMVTAGTVAIARSLDVPNEQIEKWANARQIQGAQQHNILNSLEKSQGGESG